MGIRFLCPQCGSHLQTELRHAGSLAPCPDCGQGVQVPDDAIAPGVLIGDLRLERRLGKGGMGEVYLAHQLTMDRQVAVKILSPGMTRNHLFVQRFVHEALATARLEHPNIVTIHDAGAEEGCHYLTMEYVEGESLDARLKRLKTLPEDEGLKAARTVARALAFAWDRHNMLHRDIKPANIMRGTFGEIKLMDMGLAKSTADPSITATGIAMGTPLYMSPEQARGEQGLDCRSDMYSLGATIYHLVSGSPPYPGTNAVEIITRHALEPLPPITEHNPDVSEPCIHLLETLLAKKAQQRPTTWQAVIDDIELVLAGELPNTPRPNRPSPRRHRRKRAEALRLAEQIASDMAHRDSTARVAKSIQDEENRRSFLILVVSVFAVAVGIFSLGVHLQMRRRRQAAIRRQAVPETPAGIATPAPADPVPLPTDPPIEPLPEVVPAPPQPLAVLPPAAWPPPTPAHSAARAPREETMAVAARNPPAKAGNTAAMLAGEVFRQGLDQVAVELCRGQHENARVLWATWSHNTALEVPPERLFTVNAELLATGTMPERVLRSFAADRGKTVTVDLPAGKTTLRIEEVGNGRVRGTSQVTHGRFRKSFTPAEISRREFLRRLGPEGDPTANLLRGLVCLQAQKTKTAKGHFQASGGDLAQACLRNLAEEDARRDFVKMLEKLGLPTSFRTPEALAEQARKSADDEQFQARSQLAAAAFIEKHGQTRTARQVQPVLVILGAGTRPAPPAIDPAQPPVDIAAPRH
jgi:serine/threonine protein kinase